MGVVGFADVSRRNLFLTIRQRWFDEEYDDDDWDLARMRAMIFLLCLGFVDRMIVIIDGIGGI